MSLSISRTHGGSSRDLPMTLPRIQMILPPSTLLILKPQFQDLKMASTYTIIQFIMVTGRQW